MMLGISVSLFALLCMFATGNSNNQEDRKKAMTLWDQAIAAKGGRDRLASIRSFAIRENLVVNRTIPDVVGGKIDQILCELPDQWWEFVDYRPGQMGYSLRIMNTRTGSGWASRNGASARPSPGPNADFADQMREHVAYRMRQLQYVYFLETRSLRANPLHASRVHVGSQPADRVETEIEGEKVVFFLDVNTHLPVRVETIQKVVLKDRPGVARGRTADRVYAYELDRYHEVEGIQVPSRVTLGGDTAEAHVEINPDYDRSIFTTPPAPDAGIDSWRKGAGRK